jgi:predicted nucleotidyltransferase
MDKNTIPFKDINDLLSTLVSKVSTILSDNLVGIYVYGSLVEGDFNYERSDIDLLVAVKEDITDEQFVSLDKMHSDMVDQYPAWDDRIEIAYVSLYNLKHFKTSLGKIAVISPGEPFNIKDAGKDWLINYYLIQGKSIILYGPSPQTIIEPISKDEFITSVKEQALEWKNRVVETKSSVGYQHYAVLTMCRAFYTLTFGKQPSKLMAGTWMFEKSEKWRDLIDRSLLSLSQTASTLTKNNDPQVTYFEVYDFVNEILELIDKY